MKNYLNRRDDPLDELVDSIRDLTYVLAMGREGVTKQDLITLEQNIMAKLSQIKADVVKVNADLTEGLAEITTRLDQLIADAQDPEVTDAEFLASLESVKATASQLANIANPAPTTDSGGETPAV